MSLVSPFNNIMPSSYNALTTTTRLKEARNLKRKEIVNNNIILKLRKGKMQPVHTIHREKVSKMYTACNCYTYQQDYPITINDWQNLQTPVVTVLPVPVIMPTPTLFPTHITPILGHVAQPMLPQTFVPNNIVNTANYDSGYYPKAQIKSAPEVYYEQTCYIQEVDTHTESNALNTDVAYNNFDEKNDIIESYLKLPKELFPTPNMLALDPNPIIDEFCKMPNLQRHLPWILDLEFGIPKSPITRPIPTYNVKFNSIHCKNTPDAIHPGFESCDPDFKKVLLFYYDSIVSSWYRGYMIFHCDRSVENFQSWLLMPMQVLGMCWP